MFRNHHLFRNHFRDLFREYRNYLKWKKEKARMAKSEGKYLLNMFADFSLLEEAIQKVNSNPSLKAEIITLDGTRLVLSTVAESHHGIDWDRNY